MEAHNTLLVDGPASLLLREGSASVLGAPVQPDSSLSIKKDRRVTIEADTNSLVETRLGPSASFQLVQGSTIPASWKETAETLKGVRGVAVILGDVDTGKSTLCTYLANRCFRSGAVTRVIDADPGQADIGPPTTISSSRVSSNIFSLQELKPENARFIGTTSPFSVEDKHIRSIGHLGRDISSRDMITIVNTDGWVREESAVDHKLRLLTTLQPDIILALSTDHELDTILDLQKAPVLQLEVSKFARTRTRQERKRSRDHGYGRFLQNSSNLELKTNKVKLRMFNLPQQQRIDQSSYHKGTLAGLLDSRGELLSIGRILEMRHGMIRVTTATKGRPAVVELGGVVLSTRFEEVGFES